MQQKFAEKVFTASHGDGIKQVSKAARNEQEMPLYKPGLSFTKR